MHHVMRRNALPAGEVEPQPGRTGRIEKDTIGIGRLRHQRRSRRGDAHPALQQQVLRIGRDSMPETTPATRTAVNSKLRNNPMTSPVERGNDRG